MTNKIINRDGKEFVEIDHHEYGLGLIQPEVRELDLPTLASSLREGLPSFETIRRAVQSEEWASGRRWFDSSWIKNQNGWGKCASSCMTGILEKVRFIGGQPRQELSDDYLYSLVNDGRDAGSRLKENYVAARDRGICLRETVKPGEIYRGRYNTQVADAEAKRFRCHEPYATPDEHSIAAALYMKCCVGMAIHVTGAWQSFDSDDILAPSGSGYGNHSEHLDDIAWSTKHGCFLYRKCTSHGRNYSGDGYCWTTWDRHYRVTSRNYTFYAVASAIQDPKGDNPL